MCRGLSVSNSHFADDAAATVDTPIQSGQLQIRVTVNVIYEIE